MRQHANRPIFDSDNSLRHRQDVTQFVSGPIYFDRAIQKSAKGAASGAANTGTQFGVQANQIGSSLIPGLETEAQHPYGFTPTQKNNMLVASQEAVGGAGSGISGEAALGAARTRNAGGFARALDENARQRQRQLSTNALGVENENARMALERQNQAQRMLSSLYGTDTSAQLRAMGLENEDLNTALQAGKTGWLQNLEGVLETGADVAKAYKG